MILFVDIETTGLEAPSVGSILEAAFILVDDGLHEIACCSIPIRPLPGFDNMVPFVEQMHTDNGLLLEARNSIYRRYQAEEYLTHFVMSYVPPEELGKLVIAGNSVHFDKSWIAEHMPKLHSLFHYRIIDISSINELLKRWNPILFDSRPRDESSHRALSDARSSLDTLIFYKNFGVFNAY